MIESEPPNSDDSEDHNENHHEIDMLLVHDAHSETAPHLSSFESAEDHQYDDHEMRERIRQHMESIHEHNSIESHNDNDNAHSQMYMYYMQLQQQQNQQNQIPQPITIPTIAPDTTSTTTTVSSMPLPPVPNVNPAHLAIPLASIPPFTAVGIDSASGHYIVVPAPYNHVFYTVQAFQWYSNALANSQPPTLPSYRPAPRRRPRKKRQAEENIEKKDEEPQLEEKKSKNAPASAKCYSLTIGDYARKAKKEDGNGIEVKFYFGRKAITYELIEYETPKFQDSVAETSKNLKVGMRNKMEYKFSSITALSFEDLPEAMVKMTLDLLEPPSFSEKHRTFQSGNIGWRKRFDFTNNQASTNRRHILVFDKKEIDKAKETLLRYLVDVPTVNESADSKGFPTLESPTLAQPTQADTSGWTFTVQPPLPQPLPRKKQKTDDICKCIGGCNTYRCQCVKESKTCTNCKCKSCKNPFSVLLRILKVDKEYFARDQCFLDNVLKIKDMEQLLLDQAHGTCECGTFTLQVKDALLQKYVCPSCHIPFQYSWCLNMLIDDIHRPKAHCVNCKHCTDYPCPKCHIDESHDDESSAEDSAIQDAEVLDTDEV